MLMGEFHHNIDDKGRLIIPSKFRSELGERFIITKGLDKCLFVYSMNELKVGSVVKVKILDASINTLSGEAIWSE